MREKGGIVITLEDIERMVEEIGEVDGIPLAFSTNEYPRLGFFSIKEDESRPGDFYDSDDENLVCYMEWFQDTSTMTADAFIDYDTARFWSHP